MALSGAHEVEATELVAPPIKLTWSAIWGGAVAALGIWVLLYAFGLALGLSTMEPSDPSSFKSSGIFTGVWGLVAPLIALFVGGVVSGRGSGAMTRTGGALHGLVMWGVTTLAGVYLIASLAQGVVGSVASMGRSAVEAGTGVVRGVANNAGGAADVAKQFGLNADDALQPVNQRLQAEGKPTVTPQQLETAAKGVVQQAVQSGRIDRELLVNQIAQSTSLGRPDAEDLANRVETQFNEAKAQASQRLNSAAQAAQQGALKAADATGKAFWGIFGALLLGMISGIVGATVGVSRRQRVWAAAPTTASVPFVGSTGRAVHS